MHGTTGKKEQNYKFEKDVKTQNWLGEDLDGLRSALGNGAI
jgi:hypothetical protein